jgi:hypothetical protein
MAVMRSASLLLVLTAFTAPPAAAYSVLAHLAAVDAAWDEGIQPLLLERYPDASPAALARARSFAYGGSAIQDLGYYPFGNKFFSNLLHYVRSGDFVEALVREARDLDEYAFALGALAHYACDNTGHPAAVNKAVAIAFPKLRLEFGNTVTYVQAPKQHVIVEFSFDVIQAAGGAYLPDAYRSFIGFRVAPGVLERAFAATYGLDMGDLFADQDRAIGTYRYAISEIMPALTRAAWRDKREEIARLTPGIDSRRFVFTYRRADFEQEHGRRYQRPGCFARFVGFLYRLVPKIGPLAPLRFKAPTAEAERLFAESFRQAAARFKAALADLREGRIELRNTVFDTGRAARHGEYALADDTYLELLEELADKEFRGVPQALRRNIVEFYGRAPSPVTKRERKRWDRVEHALGALLGGAAR